MDKLQQIGTSKICPVVALMRNGKLLIGLRNYTPDKWKTISVWTIPGGRCDDGETIETTLWRETAEEVGISNFKITDFLGEIPGAKEGDIVYLFAGTTDKEPQLLEPEKISEWKWEDVNNVPENFINPLMLELIKKFASKEL